MSGLSVNICEILSPTKYSVEVGRQGAGETGEAGGRGQVTYSNWEHIISNGFHLTQQVQPVRPARDQKNKIISQTADRADTEPHLPHPNLCCSDDADTECSQAR